jgi:hypothetical protein
MSEPALIFRRNGEPNSIAQTVIRMDSEGAELQTYKIPSDSMWHRSRRPRNLFNRVMTIVQQWIGFAGSDRRRPSPRFAVNHFILHPSKHSVPQKPDPPLTPVETAPLHAPGVKNAPGSTIEMPQTTKPTGHFTIHLVEFFKMRQISTVQMK